MRKDWVDPRDGQSWVITVLPFGYRGSGHHTRRSTQGSVSIAFHRPGELPLSTRYAGEKGLDALSDQDVMGLLDEAAAVGQGELAAAPQWLTALRRGRRAPLLVLSLSALYDLAPWPSFHLRPWA